MKEAIHITEIGIKFFDDGTVDIYRATNYPPYYGQPRASSGRYNIGSFKSPVEAMSWLKNNFLETCKKKIQEKEENYQKLSNEYKSKRNKLSEIKTCL